MYAHLCKGLSLCNEAQMYNEILLSYAGIIRIRFLGMISASVTRAPLQMNVFDCMDLFVQICSANIILYLELYHDVK